MSPDNPLDHRLSICLTKQARSQLRLMAIIHNVSMQAHVAALIHEAFARLPQNVQNALNAVPDLTSMEIPDAQENHPSE